MLLVLHNERNIVADLVQNYAKFGPMDVIVVDDHSTDGTREFLQGQDDITLYEPKPGSQFGRDKKHWRGQLLDRYGTVRWCLTPDADERLVWFDIKNRSFAQLLMDLDAEGAEAYIADMVDMYDDRPIADHIAEEGSLIPQFPFFDDPVADTTNDRVMMVPGRRFRRKYPTPQT